MLGTYASVLAQKKIRTHSDVFSAEVEGDVADVDGLLKLTAIRVRYRLNATPEEAVEARKCFEKYLRLCPVAQSVVGCIDIGHELLLDTP